jgi:predicted amidohydrolase YtcJ
MSSVKPADFIFKNAHVVTLDRTFSTAQSLAVLGDKILSVGSDAEVARHTGPGTKCFDAHGRTILPGLCDSHVHSYRASVSEWQGPAPVIESLAGAFDYIRERASSLGPDKWIILERVYPTRMREGRLPTKTELDKAAPNNPVYWNCGPVSLANSRALQSSGIDRNTADPKPGEIVRDRSGEATGLLRNAAQLLKIVAPVKSPTRDEQREAVRHLHHLYNRRGITSISERRTDEASIECFRDLAAAGDLTVRVNCTRMMDPVPQNLPDALKKLEEMRGGSGGKPPLGPTGVGDDWVRMGPLKVLLDGGMLIGTAYMREPWGTGPTYQITDPAYRGLLNVKPELLQPLYLAAAKTGWQLAAHCTGEASVDVLLDCYQQIQREMDIRHRRFEICHANFQSARNFQRCVDLGIVADMQPAWLYKDGVSLLKTLSRERMRWFQPLKAWLAHGLTIGGGSDHMVILDSIHATNPWDPWLGMWVAETRQMEHGGTHNPSERLTREQVLRFYTINNAKLNFEENKKGSLEPGKLADFIIVDRDVVSCSANELRETKVLQTVVGGKTVWDARCGDA